VIDRWSGREAHALRQAMRMSIDDFAAHAQVSPRSVARWAQRGVHIRLRWDVQRLLDGVLAAAGPQVQARLTELLASPEHPRSLDRPTLHALIDAMLHPARPGPEAPRLIHLERAVARTHMAVQSCQYARAGDELPGLMRLVAAAQATPDPRVPQRLCKLAAEVYWIATDLLLKLDDVPMAMLAAQRCEREARASGQPLAIAGADRATVRVLTRCGQQRHAASLARRAADRLASATGLDGPRPLSGYGALLLRGAIAHAGAGERSEAMLLLGEASGIAARLGEDANFGWTAFDPANVALHRMSALLSLGDAGMALHVAGELDPQRIRPLERRAAWHVGTARACHTLGKEADARAAIQRAESIAPDEIHLRPANLMLAEELGLRVDGRRSPGRTSR
jgi:hypothetical protein